MIIRKGYFSFDRMLFEGVGIEKVAKLTRLTEEYVSAIRAFYETHDYDSDVAPLTMVSIERIEINPYLHSVATNPLVSKRKGLYTVTFSTF